MPILKKGGAVNKAAVFNNSDYGEIGQDITTLRNEHFEVECRLLVNNRSIEQGIIDIEAAFISSAWRGFLLKIGTPGQLRAGVFGSFVNITPNDTIPIGSYTKINALYYSGDVHVFINDVFEQTTVVNNSGNWVTGGWDRIAGSQANPTDPIIFLDGNIDYVKYYELNSSGVRINSFLDYSFNNGDINTVPNIGADAPASSDMTWVPAGSGEYVDI